MTIRSIVPNELTLQPWPNGGGTMRELVFGEAWRFALASVLVDGPFSEFPDIDRLSILLRGENLSLRLADGTQRALQHVGDSARYPGDVPTMAVVFEGHELLNVMTTRGRARSELVPVFETDAVPGDEMLVPGPSLLFAIEGHARLAQCDAALEPATARTGEQAWLVSTGQYLFVEAGHESRLRLLEASDVRSLAMITIRREAGSESVAAEPRLAPLEK